MTTTQWGNSDYLPPEKYLKPEEIKRLREYVAIEAARARKNGTRRGLINYMLIELMLTTGLRAAEVCNLQLQDLPTHHGENRIIVRHGKGNKLGGVEVSKELRGQLQEYLSVCRKGAKPASPVFVNEWGQRDLKCKVYRKNKIHEHTEKTARLSYQELYFKIKRIGKRAGIANLYPHKLRHTFGTLLYKIEKDIRNTQKQMRHKDIRTTMCYAAVTDDAAKRQAEGLHGAITGAADNENTKGL